MCSIKSICAVLAVLAVGTIAHADTIYDFTNMTLTENKGSTKIYGTVSGEVTINSLGNVVSGDFTATYGATSAYGTPLDTYIFDGAPSTATKTTGTSPVYDLTVFTDTTNSIKFDLAYLYSGGVVTLCSRDTNGGTGNGACDQGGTGQQSFLASSPSNEDVVSGSLVAATPEPSSVLLLGTGLLGALGVARRRFVRS